MVKPQYTKKMVSWDQRIPWNSAESVPFRAEYQGESKDLLPSLPVVRDILSSIVNANLFIHMFYLLAQILMYQQQTGFRITKKIHAFCVKIAISVFNAHTHFQGFQI
jgi:hypothetical protein